MKLHLGIVFKVFLKKKLLWFTSNAFNNICLSRIERVSKWLLLNANSAIFQLYHGEEVNFQWDGDEVHFVLDQHA